MTMGRKYCLTRVYMHLKFAGRNESWDCLAPCVLHVPASCASGYLCSAHVFGPTYSTPLAQKRPLLGPTGEENFSKTLDTNCLMRSFEWPTGVGGADPPSKRMRACLTPGADRRTGEAGWISSSLSVSPSASCQAWLCFRVNVVQFHSGGCRRDPKHKKGIGQRGSIIVFAQSTSPTEANA